MLLLLGCLAPLAEHFSHCVMCTCANTPVRIRVFRFNATKGDVWWICHTLCALDLPHYVCLVGTSCRAFLILRDVYMCKYTRAYTCVLWDVSATWVCNLLHVQNQCDRRRCGVVDLPHSVCFWARNTWSSIKSEKTSGCRPENRRKHLAAVDSYLLLLV